MTRRRNPVNPPSQQQTQTQKFKPVNTQELLKKDRPLRRCLTDLSLLLSFFLSPEYEQQLSKIEPENLLNNYRKFNTQEFQPGFQDLNSQLIGLNSYNRLNLPSPILTPRDVAAISTLAHWFGINFLYAIQLKRLLKSHPKLHIADTLTMALESLEKIIERFQQNVFATATAHTFFDEIGLCLGNESLSCQLKSAIGLAFAFCKETRQWLAPLQESLTVSDFERRREIAEKAQQKLLAEYKKEKAARRVQTKPKPTPGNESPSTLSGNSDSGTESQAPSIVKKLKPPSDYNTAKLLISRQQYEKANQSFQDQLQSLPAEQDPRLLRRIKLNIHQAVCLRLWAQNFVDYQAIYRHYHQALGLLKLSIGLLNHLSADFRENNATRLDALKRGVEVELYTLHSALEKLDEHVSNIVEQHQKAMHYLSENHLHRSNSTNRGPSPETQLFRRVENLPPQIEACMSGVMVEANEIDSSLSANAAP